MSEPEFVTTQLPGGLLRVEVFASGRCQAAIVGVSEDDAERFKAACSVQPSGHIKIDALTLDRADSLEFGDDIRVDRDVITFPRP